MTALVVTDEAKLQFFPSHLERSALDWRHFAWEAQLSQGWIQLSSGPVKPTWDALERLFKTHYCLLEERAVARHKMKIAQMNKSKAGSLLAYTKQFRLKRIKVNSGVPPGQGVSEGIVITEYSGGLCSPQRNVCPVAGDACPTRPTDGHTR
jgi:hypothetical protein